MRCHLHSLQRERPGGTERKGSVLNGGSASGLSTVPSFSFPAQPFFYPFSSRCVAFNRPLRSPSPDPLPAPAKGSEGRKNDDVTVNELEYHPDASCSPSPEPPSLLCPPPAIAQPHLIEPKLLTGRSPSGKVRPLLTAIGALQAAKQRAPGLSESPQLEIHSPLPLRATDGTQAAWESQSHFLESDRERPYSLPVKPDVSEKEGSG